MVLDTLILFLPSLWCWDDDADTKKICIFFLRISFVIACFLHQGLCACVCMCAAYLSLPALLNAASAFFR